MEKEEKGNFVKMRENEIFLESGKTKGEGEGEERIHTLILGYFLT